MARINPIYCPRCGGSSWSCLIGESLTFDTANAMEEGKWMPMPVLIHCSNNNCYPRNSGVLSNEDAEYVMKTGMFKRLLNHPREEIEIEQPHKRTLRAKRKRKEPD